MLKLPDYHKSIDVLHYGCEKPRAYFVPFESEAATLSEERENSKFFKSLCGAWDFKWYKSVNDVQGDTVPSFPEEFDKLDVPMNWQVALGRGYDAPNYTNVNYPYPDDPHHLPDMNPCGLYRRYFALTEEMLTDKEVYINFEGVASCFYLWVNGSFAAYSQVSHMTSEINVTEYLKVGKNEIKVLVFKWCDGSYLEAQEMWRMSGIFREVYLLFREKVHVIDVDVKLDIPFDMRETDIYVSVKTNAKLSINALVYAPDGTFIDSVKRNSKSPKFRFMLNRPTLWNHEEPNLYNLVLQCGKEYIRIPIGIKRFEVINGVVFINGRKVKAKGVNLHDSHPVLGHATPYQHMIEALMIMKRHNVNTIRTLHYPNDPRFLELCDKYGFYVVDETDIEYHGVGIYGDRTPLTTDTAWTEGCLDRAERMYQRDKNHVSLIMYKSGEGLNQKKQIEFFKRCDAFGLVYPDRTTRTGFLEAKQAYCQAYAEAIDLATGKFRIHNLRNFTSLEDTDIFWSVEVNGVTVQNGSIPKLSTEQGESTVLIIPYDLRNLTGRAYVNISFRNNVSLPWADAGYETSFNQYELPVPKSPKTEDKRVYPVEIKEDDNAVTVEAGDTVYTVCKTCGLVTQITDNGKDMLTKPIRPTIWRAPTDNDMRIKTEWESAGYDKETVKCYGVKAGLDNVGNAKVKAKLSIGALSKLNLLSLDVTYTVYRTGKMSVKTEVDNTAPVFLPKFGYEIVMPENSEKYSYFGCGPYESYPDKHLASRMGLFKGNVSDNMEHYIYPQENCSHYKTEYASVRSFTGHGLAFEADSSFTFRASHYSAAQLTAAKHDCELVPSPETYVSIDYKQSGIGSNSCGPELHENFRFNEKHFEFEFTVKPVR